MKKRFSAVTALILTLVLTFSLCAPAFAYDAPTRYLLLGDSIAEGYGVANPDEASYGRIVADTNGYEYENLARYATDTGDLLKRLNDYYWYRSAVRDADIISLSIGANNYLASEDVVSIAAGALFHLNGRQLDEIAEGIYTDLCGIIDVIDELNPDATILLQTVYSVWYGFAANAFDSCAKRCNAMVNRYAEEHPGRVVICDIAPAMNGIHENLADDCVHPNAAGNVAIARIVLQKLHELGLGKSTEPVVNTPGVDYNFYEETISPKLLGKFVTILIKLLTGNGSNIRR